jgi:arginine/ornithine N-succinyltransferase beta subunit
MLVIRAITLDDLDPLIEMARQVGSGMTTLKPDRAMLGDRVATAVGLVRPDHPAGRARLHVRDGRHRERPAGRRVRHQGRGRPERTVL